MTENTREKLNDLAQQMANEAYLRGYIDGYKSMIARMRNVERVSDEWLDEVANDEHDYE